MPAKRGIEANIEKVVNKQIEKGLEQMHHPEVKQLTAEESSHKSISSNLERLSVKIHDDSEQACKAVARRIADLIRDGKRIQ